MDSRGTTSARLLLLIAVAAVLQSGPSCALRDKSLDEGFVLKSKRPFCNAFTGCGRKRSSGGGGDVEQTNGMDFKDQIDEIARHILGQDRMLEQLQQKVELMRALACGYPEIPAQSLYRRRRDVPDMIPAHTSNSPSFPDYVAAPHAPKRHDPTPQRAQTSYYFADEQLQKKQHEKRRKNESNSEHDDAGAETPQPNHGSTEEAADFEDRNDGIHRGKEGRNKSVVSDQE